MALVLKDRVKQAAAAPGTGTITLGATPTGFQSFASVGNGNTTYFAIVDSVSGDWEVNYGVYTSSGTTLTRNSTPLSSSNSGSLVNFTGAVDVFLTYPSEKAVWQDVSGVVNATAFGAITATSAALTTGTISTTPVVDIDLVNKQYVDTVAADGIHYHEAVFVESPNTAGNLTATYTSGGTNANIIQIANGTDITFFGVSASVGDQFLTSTGNGLLANTPYYIVADLGGNTYQISLTYGGSDVTGLTNGAVTLPSLINPGVGAYLTNAGAQVALTIDGVLMTVGKRVLIYNQTNGFENGVYTVTTVGTGSTNWVLTRATDADTYSPSSSLALGQGDAFYVTDGDTGAGESYVVSTNGDIFFGITAITFAQISSAQIYNAGTGLNLSPATTFNISNTGVTANTYGSASAVPVVTFNAQGQATGVTNTNIAINGSQVSGNITGSAGSVANALTLGTYLTGGTYNGSAAVTATVDATSANTASKVVARDSSGNFSAGTITATLNGTATSTASATNLSGGAANQIPYQTGSGATSFITAASGTNTVLNFNGSTFSWSAGTISGVPLGSNLNSLTAGTYLTGTAYNGSAAQTWTVDATSANTASKVVARDASGNFSAGTITAALSGNALTATTATNQSGGTVNATTGAFSGVVNLTNGGTGSASSLNVSGDITAYRSATAGVIYMGSNRTSYVQYDGSNWYLGSSSGGLIVSGNTVLTYANYNSYAPTLTGTGASGTWGINITGSAGSAGSATTAVNLSGGTVTTGNTVMTSGWNRVMLLSATYPVLVWGSNSTSYSGIGVDYSGANSRFNFWINGTSADISGTGTIAMTMNSGNYVSATGSFRAPIFYDSDNTSYYADFGGTSFINTLVIGTNGEANPYGAAAAGKLYFGTNAADASTNYHITTNMENAGGNYSKLDFKWYTGQRFYAAGVYAGFRFFEINGGAEIFSINNYQYGLGASNVYANNSLVAGSSLRAPIFYDSNNTGYYGDFASTSSFNEATFAGYIGLGGIAPATNMSGTYGISIYNANYPAVGFSTAAGPNYLIYRLGSGGPLVVWNSTNSETVFFYSSYTRFTGSAQAPIFYDSDDTAFYVNPNGTSRIRRTDLISSGSGWDDCLNLYSSDQSNRWNFLVDQGDSNSLRIAYNNSEALRINTSRNVTANVDFRAPIFYDSNDTNYYVDPNGTSYLLLVRFLGGTGIASRNVGTAYSEAACMREAPGGSSSSNMAYAPRLGFHWGGVVASSIAIETSGRIAIMDNPGTGYEDFIADISYASASSRAPIFYDSNDTGYYVNPNGTSQFSRVEANFSIEMRSSAGGGYPAFLVNQYADVSIYRANNATAYIGFSADGLAYLYNDGTNFIFSGRGLQATSFGVGTAPSGTTGEIRATNNITAYYSSDIKFKTNVRDIPNALEIAESIGGKLFDWTDEYIEEHGGEDGYFIQKEDFGVIAQDVLKVFPVAVRTRPDGSLAVDYEKLSAVAFAAVASLSTRVKSLEARI